MDEIVALSLEKLGEQAKRKYRRISGVFKFNKHVLLERPPVIDLEPHTLFTRMILPPFSDEKVRLAKADFLANSLINHKCIIEILIQEMCGVDMIVFDDGAQLRPVMGFRLDYVFCNKHNREYAPVNKERTSTYSGRKILGRSILSEIR
jgi:hypothetical protein